MTLKLNDRIQQFIKDTSDFVTMPDMRQCNGNWLSEEYRPERCCFGARVARAICTPIKSLNANNDVVYRWYFGDGRNAMLHALDVTDDELRFILYVCGAGITLPFSGNAWGNSPKHVYQQLIKIERRPTDKDIKVLIDCHGQNLPSDSEEIQKVYRSLCKRK